MKLMMFFALALIALTFAYVLQHPSAVEPHNPYEPFVGRGSHTTTGSAGVEPVRTGTEIADVTAGPLLSDILTVKKGFTPYDASGCAGIDRARQMELGGQYVQRTNNYRHQYPDDCTAPRTDFVGAIYDPKDGVGLTVPFDGSC